MSSVGGKNKAGPSNDYEVQIFENIERNKKRLAALNIPDIINSLDQQHRPKKTSKKNHGTSIAASKPPNLRPRPQRNNSQFEKEPVLDDLQPIGDFLTDNVEAIHNEDTSNGTITKRVGRSITKMDHIFSRTPEMSKIKVSLNEYGQPIGKSGRQFSSVVGCHVRKKLSIAYKDWRLIDIEKKLQLWTDIKKYYDIDDDALNWFMCAAWTKWKQFKSEIKDKYFDPEVTLEEIPECPDKRVNDDTWQSVYEYWMSSVSKERSKTAKVNQKQGKLHHTSGSVSFACSKHDLAEKLGRPPRRDEVFVKTHLRKNGVPSQQAEPIIKEIEQILTIYPELKDNTIQQGDILALVYGEKEPKGFVRVLGLGPTPQDIGTPGLKSYTPTRLQMEIRARKKVENEKTALEKHVLQLQSQIEERAEKDRASEEPVSHYGSTTHKYQSMRNDVNDLNYENEEAVACEDEEDHMVCDQTDWRSAVQIATTSRPNGAPQSKHDALVGKDVILYAMLRSDLPVAKGTIISTKPETVVGGEPLGRQYCQVIVTCVLKRDAILPRPYGNMETMANTKMRSLAWPYKKLKITNKESTSG
ncbi:uncharacterized protein LOC112875826 isoform X5 [Panicum hallii]|nr:uncharacterized protein LOC112875826 isoform X5 [Panicum hallii]